MKVCLFQFIYLCIKKVKIVKFKISILQKNEERILLTLQFIWYKRYGYINVTEIRWVILCYEKSQYTQSQNPRVYIKLNSYWHQLNLLIQFDTKTLFWVLKEKCCIKQWNLQLMETQTVY
ncbi:unnamed protein product [Paramecium sonneborni]|uniref:Uncharacterized protein n=1 Tax=Paramecium sonneborni TaxID=65129 RepID=A0A8S1QBY3_9CILI|nr:unnamed protein product [Paramecium sonneborni]